MTVHDHWKPPMQWHENRKCKPQSPKAIILLDVFLRLTTFPGPLSCGNCPRSYAPQISHTAHLCHSAQVPPFQKQLGLPKHVVSTCNHFRFPTFPEGWWWLPHHPSHKGIGLIDHCVFPCGCFPVWFLCHVDLSNASAVFWLIMPTVTITKTKSDQLKQTGLFVSVFSANSHVFLFSQLATSIGARQSLGNAIGGPPYVINGATPLSKVTPFITVITPLTHFFFGHLWFYLQPPCGSCMDFIGPKKPTRKDHEVPCFLTENSHSIHGTDIFTYRFTIYIIQNSTKCR